MISCVNTALPERFRLAKTIGEINERTVSDLMLGDANYPKDGVDLTFPDPNLILGLELEIENWKGLDRAQILRDQRWALKTDGSLRGEARELITLPTKAKFLQRLLKDAYERYAVQEEDFSERCSVHVHMNVLDYTMDQLKVLCICYQMFERLLYTFVGRDRKDNIFCVPWYESGMSHSFLDNTKSSMSEWEKYTALNLLPVQAQGTVEFRHLYGTCDVSVIMQWVRLIARLHLFARKTTIKGLSEIVLNMNTVSNYDQFLMDVFGEDAGVLRKDHYQATLSIGVVDAKLMFLSPATKKREVRRPAAPANAREVEDLFNELAIPANPANPNPFEWNPVPVPRRRVQADDPAITPAQVVEITGAMRAAGYRWDAVLSLWFRTPAARWDQGTTMYSAGRSLQIIQPEVPF